MHFALAFLCILVHSAVAAPLSYEYQWRTWKENHRKVYGSVEEEQQRCSIWLSNMHYIEEHNRNADKHGFTLKMNTFGDMTLEEWTEYYSCHKVSYSSTDGAFHAQLYRSAMSQNDLPKAVDWRKHKVVTEVKNQEEYRCHSCYAFAATGALESAHAIKTGQLVSLSEQQILDCSRIYTNAACRGGNYRFAWVYIISNGGIDTESSYPYTSQENTCQFQQSSIGATAKAITSIESGNETDLQAAVAFNGPVAVAIDHARRSFQFYSNGIYNDYSCSSSYQNLTHEMLVIGYGVNSDSEPYWILKNSYGYDWGINGYMYMMRNKNVCGIAMDAGFPVV